MRSDRNATGMTTRQKVTIGIFAIVVLIIIWQIKGLFTSSTPAPVPSPAKVNAMAPGAPGQPVPPPQAVAPKPAPAAPLSQRELELIRLQQETEAKYIAAVNELQMLKVQRDIAETNKAIATAKLDTVTAQKGIVQLLTVPAPQPVTPGDYAQNLVNPASTSQQSQPQPAKPAEVSYTVISVSQIQYRWNAVLGYQGNLYNVNVGDVLPPDGSKVVSIDRSGVVLEKNGEKKKVSLVSII